MSFGLPISLVNLKFQEGDRGVFAASLTPPAAEKVEEEEELD